MTQPHPQMEAILLAQQNAPTPNPETLPIAEARANFEHANVAWNTPLPPMDARDLMCGGVSCRLVVPPGMPSTSTTRPNASSSLVLFIHGGGWTFGSPATHERFARLLAQASGAAVLLPDYHLAPEHPAPAGIEDVLAVMADLDAVVQPDTKLVLCGDSAGANIALGAALSRPSRSITMLSLLYGCFAPVFDTESHRRNGDGRFGLSTARMQWYWANWLGQTRDPRAAPLHGDMAGLPRCHLLAAELDPLCDDSFLLAGRLAAASVPLRLDVVPGVTHGFLQMSARLQPAQDAIAVIAAEIAAACRPNDDQPPRSDASPAGNERLRIWGNPGHNENNRGNPA
jgi:acetyl esterase